MIKLLALIIFCFSGFSNFSQTFINGTISSDGKTEVLIYAPFQNKYYNNQVVTERFLIDSRKFFTLKINVISST